MDQVCSFFLGDVATCMARATLVPGGPELILYGTAAGALGMFYPFEKMEDHDFFLHLELNLRSVRPPLLGRDHLAYRSFYSVSRNVVDGDLCEQFGTLVEAERAEVLRTMEHTKQEVLNRL